MDMLARREHGHRELAAKLVAKGFESQLVGSVVDQLESENLVSDARFVEALYHQRTQRGYGPARIAAELRDKGVADDLITQWVDFADRQWISRLQDLRRRKYGDAPPVDARERARQMRFLQSRGFTLEQIRRVMNNNDNWD